MSLTKILVTAVVALLCIVLGVGGYFLYDAYRTNLADQQASEEGEQYVAEFLETLDPEEELSGAIYLTTIAKREGFTTPIGPDGRLFPFRFYGYDLAQGAILPDPLPYMVWYPHTAENGDMVFVSQPSGWVEYEPTIFIKTPEGNPIRQDHSEYGDDTASIVTERRLPRWSEDGAKYLYSLQLGSSLGREVPVTELSSWKIFVAKPGAEAEYFADGYGAQWFGSDEYILYVKSDGIYAKRYIEGANHQETPEMRVIGDYYTYQLNNHIDTFKDYVAVSYPLHDTLGDSYVQVYKLTLEDEDRLVQPILRVVLDENLYPMWPIFSPGGRYLSMQTFDHVSDTDNNHIKVFDFFTRDFVAEVSVNDYYFDYAFNTDWVSDGE